jgi:hypothetical protein
MRCDEVIRELAVPTAGRDDLAMAQHIARCESCARWADRAEKLDRLWDATRPADPSPQAWDALWSSVTAKLDQAAALCGNGSQPTHSSDSMSKHLSFPSSAPSQGPTRPWGTLGAMGVIGLAQAAALLLAIGLSWHAPVKVPPLPASLSQDPRITQHPIRSLNSEIEVRQGQVVLIRSEGAGVEVVDLPAQETPNGMDGWLLVYNEFEPFSMSEIEVEEGQVVLIRSQDSKVDVIDLTAQETAHVVGRWLLDRNEVERTLLLGQLRSWSVDQWMFVYNELEWLAGPALALR